jgi:DNA-binding transcriptional regulator LsrR (DeoR family)
VIKILQPDRWHNPPARDREQRFALDIAIVVDDDRHRLSEIRRRVGVAASADQLAAIGGAPVNALVTDSTVARLHCDVEVPDAVSW